MEKEKETMNEEAKVTGEEISKDDFMKITLSKNYESEDRQFPRWI